MNENSGAMMQAWNNLPKASKFLAGVFAGAIGVYFVKEVLPQAIDKGYDVGATIDQDGIHFGMRASINTCPESIDHCCDNTDESDIEEVDV